MGWIEEDLYDVTSQEHEGWAAWVTRDERIWGTTSMTGVHRYDPATGVEHTQPWAEVVAFRTACTCGWTGRTFPIQHVPGSKAGPVDAEDVIYIGSGNVDAAAYVDWREHIAPLLVVAEVRAAAREVARAETALAAAVRRARTRGVSWPQIGRETGLSAERAEDRWDDHGMPGRRR